MHEVLVNRLGGLGLPRKSVVWLTDRPDMTLDVYRGRKATMQQCKKLTKHILFILFSCRRLKTKGSVLYDDLQKYRTDIVIISLERIISVFRTLKCKAFQLDVKRKKEVKVCIKSTNRRGQQRQPDREFVGKSKVY